MIAPRATQEHVNIAQLTEEVLQVASDAGLDAVGICSADPFEGLSDELRRRESEGLTADMGFTYRKPDVSSDPSQSLPNARTIVVAAMRYASVSDATTPSAVPTAAIARYAWTDIYAELKTRLKVVNQYLRANSYKTRVLADDNAVVDRALAVRAGIGWQGKNANILIPGEGSWFVLGCIVTNAPLITFEEPSGGTCGNCTDCIPACPTNAIVANGVIDASKCIPWVLQRPGVIPEELRGPIGNRIYGCDDCQTACPHNSRALRIGKQKTTSTDSESTVDIVDALSQTDEELMGRFDRWYVAERDPKYLRRNLLIVLGNTASGSDPDARAALAWATLDSSPIVRAHAVWAAKQLGLFDLLKEVRMREQDQLVLDELVDQPAIKN